MSRPVVAVLTDFGLRDHYAGTMKGVVLGVCPDVTLVDITHEISAHDVQGGALELSAAVPYFPRGTVFLVVVDPGVGTTRRGLAASSNGRSFVAPDNGVLSLVLDSDAEVVALPPATATSVFEGRDRFAPVAGRLAAGATLTDVGQPTRDVVRFTLPAPRVQMDVIDGEVIRVDRFGNLMTNITSGMLTVLGTPVRIDIGALHLREVVRAYGDVPQGAPCALVDSSGRLEIAVGAGSAASSLAAGRGTTVRVRRVA